MTMVTRYRIADKAGRYLTIDGLFVDGTDDAVEYRDFDEAADDSDELGQPTSIETFSRYSAVEDRKPSEARRIAA